LYEACFLVLLFRYQYFQVGQKLGNLIQQQDSVGRTKNSSTFSQSFGHQHQPSALVYTFSQQDSTAGRTNTTTAMLSQSIGLHHNPSHAYSFKQPEGVPSGRNKGNGIVSQPQSIIRQQQSQLSYSHKKDVQPSSKWDDVNDEEFADILG
jgi:hypothetical protein